MSYRYNETKIKTKIRRVRNLVKTWNRIKQTELMKIKKQIKPQHGGTV